VLAAGVFNSGVLVGGSTFDYRAAPADVLVRRRALEELCAQFGAPLTAAAIQFPLRHPAVAAVLVGARSPHEIEEDARLLDVPIPEELWAALDYS
jgi:D-threo-aldose 1-dehydrogenase